MCSIMMITQFKHGPTQDYADMIGECRPPDHDGRIVQAHIMRFLQVRPIPIAPAA